MHVSKEMYHQLQPLLFSLAYRMVGSVADAEDIVQETFMTATQLDETKLDNVKAYLCKMTTNRCLDLLKSSRKKREQYVGPWLPEPLVLQEDDDAYAELFMKEDLSLAFIKMMQDLSEQERAVLLLREGMDLAYKDIAEIVGKTESTCRKLLSRAKQKLSAQGYHRYNDYDGNDSDEDHQNCQDPKNDKENKKDYKNVISTMEANQDVIIRFLEAFQKEDMKELLNVLAEDVVTYSDGGGKVHAALNPIVSFKRVMTFLSSLTQKMPEDFSFKVAYINGQIGLINYFGSKVQSTVSFFVSDGKIKEIYMVLNPDKLTRV